MSFRLLLLPPLAVLLLAACKDREPEKKPEAAAPESRAVQTAPQGDTESASLTEFAGGRVRVVWTRTVGDDHADTFGMKPIHQLWGLDSEDGAGERIIVPKIGNFRRPLITPDGGSVVYTDHLDNNMHLVSWDGKEESDLGPGLALDLWTDPADGRLWVYFAPESQMGVGQTTAPRVERFPIEDPKARESVWDATPVALDNFMVWPNGKAFTALFPWPHAGIADIEAGTWKKLLRGCWPDQSPDGVEISWVFDGPHKNLNFFAKSPVRSGPEDDGWRAWEVPVNSHPVLDGHETYHPRYGNHPRIFCITGPYIDTPEGGGPTVLSGGGAVEVLLGRFSADLGKVEEWRKITENARGDFYPDVWVEGGEEARLDLAEVTRDKPSGHPSHALSKSDWPCSDRKLLFAWNNNSTQNQITLPGDERPTSCDLELKGMAFLGRDHDLALGGGEAHINPRFAAELLNTLREKRRATIQFTAFAADYNKPGVRPILRLGTKETGDVLVIGQIEGKATLWSPILGINEPVEGAYLHWGKQSFVSINLNDTSGTHFYGDGTADAHRDTSNFDFPAPGEAPYLILGGESEAGDSWDGRLEKISLYGRKLEASEIDAQADAIHGELAARPEVETIEIHGKLVESQPVPSIQSLGAYTRAMVVYTYEINEVVRGKLDAKRIQVAHWAVVNKKKRLGTFPREPNPNQQVWLRIEPFDAHPQLSSERISEYGFEDPLFYDITTPLDSWD